MSALVIIIICIVVGALLGVEYHNSKAGWRKPDFSDRERLIYDEETAIINKDKNEIIRAEWDEYWKSSNPKPISYQEFWKARQ